MAQIVFNIGANTTEAHKKVEELKKYIESLKEVKVNLGISEKDLTTLSKLTAQQTKLAVEIEKTKQARAQARAEQAKATAESVKAEEATKRSTETTKRSEEATKQAAEKTKQQREALKIAKEETKQSEEATKRSTEATKRSEEATKRSTEATKQHREALKIAKEETKQSEEATKRSTEATKRSEEATARAEERTAQAAEKTKQRELELAKEREKSARAAQKSASATDQESASMGRLGTALEKAKGFMASFQKNFSSMLQSRLSSAVISAVTRNTQEALNTMREVDQQLTNIQKVSDISTDALKKLGDEAYKTASKYGVAADEYLSAVYTFQKAGLNDNAAELAELATKTMLVGDTTATIASKFLIAANAAWKMGGNINELNKIVDEADWINNNYATDLAKLSQGFPIVASTAANMGMTIEETMAVLGTITSVTQETGTKAATAWRALSMNLAGEIGTFLTEEGDEIEVTAESIKSVTDALAAYAPEAVAAAKATGTMIDPIKAVEGLAKAYKDGRLNDITLTNILMGVGGKLRTNQLTALVKNFDLYEKMLGELGHAAGTADSEISAMLESWNSKTQILKNTWTEFISHLIETGAVKKGLEFVTTIIEGLDTSMGRLVVTLGAAAAAFMALSNPFGMILTIGGGLLALIGAIKQGIEKANKTFNDATEGVRDMEQAFADADETLKKNDQSIRATAAVGQMYVERLKELRDAGIKTDDQAKEYHNTLVRLKDIMPELADMIDTENDAIRGGIPALEDRMNAWIEEARTAAQAAAVEAKATALANAEIAAAENQIKIEDTEEKIRGLAGVIEDYQKELEDLQAPYLDVTGTFIPTYAPQDVRDRVNELTVILGDLNEEQQDEIDNLGELNRAQDENNQKIAAAKEALAAEEKALRSLHGEEEKGQEEDSKPVEKTTFSLEEQNRQRHELAKALRNVKSLNEEIANEEAEIAEKTAATADAADEAAKHYQDMADSMQAALGDNGFSEGTGDDARLDKAVAAASTSLSKNRIAFDDHHKKLEETSEEIIATTETLLEDEANVFETESGAAVSAARAAGASMGKAVGMGIVDQAPFVKDAIARLLDMSRQFVGSLFASGNMSYGHGSGFTLVGAGGNNYDAFMKAWRQGQNAGRTDTVRFGSASGTSNAPGGATLVNELGPELINDNGRVFIANGGKPAVVNLSRGAIVLTAEDTKEAMRGAGSVPQRGAAQSMNALNGGGGSLGGVTLLIWQELQKRLDPVRGSPSITAGDPGWRGKTGKGPGGGGGGGSSEEEPQEETLEELAQKLTDLLGILDLQAELANNEERYSDEGDIYGKAVDAIGDMLQAYRDAGYAEDSKEILELLNQQYDYQDKQAKAYQMVWDTLEKSLSETNKNLEAQAEIAKNAGDYQKQGDLYGQALDNIHELLAQYRDAGYAEDSDEILSLLKQGNDYADKQRAAYQAAWDTLETNLSTVQKNLDLQVQLAQDAGDYGKQIELYGKQIENAQGLLEQYRQAGFAEDSDEILTLLKQINDYEGKREAVEQSRWNELQSNLSGTLKNLDLQAELARDALDYTKEGTLYGDAIASIEELLAEYRSAGYSEDSDEILTLLRQRRDYEQKRDSAEKARWGDLESNLSESLSLLDMQANLAAKAGDYNTAGGLYAKAAQENRKLLEEYRKAGYSEDSKEILTLLQKIGDYEEKQTNAYQGRWDALEKDLSDVLKVLDLQAELAQGAGDYTRAGGYYGQAQEAIQALLTQYLDAGYGEDSPEVLALRKQLAEYQNRTTEATQGRWDEMESDLADTLKKLELQASLAESNGDYAGLARLYEKAQEAIADLTRMYQAAGFADDSIEILTLLKENNEYADRQMALYQERWDEMVDAIETQTDSLDAMKQLQEKQEKLAEAQLALENAQKQRTVRIFNGETNQWEWIADQEKVKSAEESLASAEEDYADEVKSQALEELRAMRDTVTDLNDVVLGPALSAVTAMAEDSAEFQAFAKALDAVFGVGSFLQSTAGSEKVLPGSDSHDTVYSFGDIKLTEEQAGSLTLKQLAEQLRVLKII